MAAALYSLVSALVDSPGCGLHIQYTTTFRSLAVNKFGLVHRHISGQRVRFGVALVRVLGSPWE